MPKVVEINNIVRTGEETQWVGRLYDAENRDVEQENEDGELVVASRLVYLGPPKTQIFSKKGTLQASFLQSYTEDYYGI